MHTHIIKYIARSLALAIATASLTSTAFAASGSAVIPHFASRFTSASNNRIAAVFVSNITSVSVTVTITFYDTSGSVIADTGDGAAGTGQVIGAGAGTSYDDDIAGATVTFSLPAHSSESIYLHLSSYEFGYGVIEWSQSSDNVKALVAHGAMSNYYKGSTTENFRSENGVTIANGQPF